MAAVYSAKRTYPLLPSAARTDHTTGNQVTQTNGGVYKGLRLTIDISAVGTVSITFTIKGVDPISGNVYTLLASAAKSSTGTFTMLIYPGCVAVANAVLNEVLPSRWVLVPSGTIDTATYSVHAELIP
jgi:hypothetical protein